MTQTKNKIAIDGIILVNKPQNLTSNAVLQRVKHLFHAKKAGHTGSLDPLATGMLPICFGEATKFCQYLLDSDKCYDVVGRLGIKTNTSDATGEVTACVENFHVTAEQLNHALQQFHGVIQQVPSMFSALKHQGKPLYRLARAGIEVQRAPRTVTIHQLLLNSFDGQDFHLTVTCSKGTYIRNLVEDLGDTLGVGAHVTKLHRNFTAGFSFDVMYTLEDLSAKSSQELTDLLLPMERAVAYLPVCVVDATQETDLYNGKIIELEEVVEAGCVRLYSGINNFIGLGDINTDNQLTVRRLLHKIN